MPTLRDTIDQGCCTPLATIDHIHNLLRNGGEVLSIPRDWLRWLVTDAETLQAILTEEAESILSPEAEALASAAFAELRKALD
jgi:hypothetical protein